MDECDPRESEKSEVQTWGMLPFEAEHKRRVRRNKRRHGREIRRE
jgi:hypothetical protein